MRVRSDPRGNCGDRLHDWQDRGNGWFRDGKDRRLEGTIKWLLGQAEGVVHEPGRLADLLNQLTNNVLKALLDVELPSHFGHDHEQTQIGRTNPALGAPATCGEPPTPVPDPGLLCLQVP